MFVLRTGAIRAISDLLMVASSQQPSAVGSIFMPIL